MTFKSQLAEYQKIINDDIAAYAKHVRQSTRAQFGDSSAEVVGAYLDLLEGSGKRLRGMLTIVGYQMCGGQDTQMIARAATAIEMFHAYLLAFDDIQDKSDTRRGQPAVHKVLQKFAEDNDLKEPDFTGQSLAMNAGIGGMHAAQMLLAGLSVDPELKVKVIGIVNLTMLTTAHGQTHDAIHAASKQSTSEAELLNIMEWKTANYSFLNPLCVGMALAGAGCEDTNAIRDYAINTGIAFQIMDDIADGDPTVNNPEAQARQRIANALKSLELHAHRWPKQQVDFLVNLANYIAGK